MIEVNFLSVSMPSFTFNMNFGSIRPGANQEDLNLSGMKRM